MICYKDTIQLFAEMSDRSIYTKIFIILRRSLDNWIELSDLPRPIIDHLINPWPLIYIVDLSIIWY